MRRVLFSVGGVRIWSYPAFLYLGLVSGFYVMYAIAPALGIPRDRAAAAALVLFAPTIAGARLWFVFDHWAVYRQQPRRIWRHSEGGLTLYGGLVLALLVSPGLLSALGLGFARFWDAATFTILVGMIFARVGCLLNGCCSGRASHGRFGVWLRDQSGHGERRYPVQLLEMTAGALLLGLAGLLLGVHAPSGTIFVFGLTGYAVVRLALDRLREPSPRSMTNHRIALAAFLMCSAAIFAAGWLVSGL